jgi:8-oxo-dGTP pyrophosphatase MutT (NUDIX family)
MSKAAGILFTTPQGTALFLRRTATAHDFPGHWDFPGGGQENAETAEQTAEREAIEEIGFMPKGDLIFHTRTPGSMPKGVAGIGASPVLPVQAGAPTASPSLVPDQPDVDFTTFLQRVDAEFTPELNPEHDGWAWAPIGSPPQPLHPGCQIALDRISMDELGVARAIADGRLTSPQRYENVWLFAIRITGTDTAFRDKLDEFVVRKPELYLNDEFLARCNGLPVIFKHPPKSILDSDEFSNRIVGTVFLPYIAGDEVWAVTKIFVDDVARMMKNQELSTSPGVNFADFTVNAKLTLEDGSKVLIEGKPSLLDHIAICELGVWDKGGDPSGIRSESREDSAMAGHDDKAKDDSKRDDAKRDDTHKDDAARKDMEKTEATDSKRDDGKRDDGKRDDGKRDDADAGKVPSTQVDASAIMDAIKGVADRLDAFGKRMDAVEDLEKSRDDKKRKDAAKKDDDEEGEEDKPKNLAADKAKKDSEDKEKEDKTKADKAKDDSAKADSVDVRKRIEEVASMIPKDMNDQDYHALADAQARADEIYADFGKHAPRPLQGETVASYERRVVRELKAHSPTWKAAEITTAFADDASFQIVKDQVYREAKLTAASPANVQPGQLKMIEKRRDGHIVREFFGDPRSWMDPLAGQVQLRATGSFIHGNLGNR